MRLEVYPNLTGMAGTERTIAHMRRLVEVGKHDPAVVLEAHKIVKGIDRNNWLRMARVIFKFVHDKVAYVRDPVGVEFVKAPGITLKTMTGDCDDQSVLFSALAESVGMKTRFKTVKADPRYPNEYSHVYAQAMIPSRGWMSADTIVPKATFGWEAKNFPSRTWGGMHGFIDRNRANNLGDALLAAGSVGYADEPLVDGGSSFGDVFDNDDEDAALGDLHFGGSMWSNTPVLANPNEKINTIADAPPDFWGGQADTPPGPGMKSRMLPPGVGSLNGLQLGYVRDENGELWVGYMDGMGRWRPFKKLRKRIRKVVKKVTPRPLRKLHKKITQPFRKAGQRISTRWKKGIKKIEKGFKKVGHKLAKGVGMSTPESREKASRTSVDAALKNVWNSEGTQVAIALNERAQDMVNALQEGRVPKWAKGPPPTMQGYLADLSRCPKSKIDGMGGYAAAIMAVAGALKAHGAKKDAQAATAALDKYVKNFPSERLNAAVEEVTKLFIASGGMMPAAGEAPSAEFVSDLQTRGREGKSEKNTGWTYHDMWQLIHDLEQLKSPLQSAKQAFEAAHKAHMKTEGAATIQTAASVVEKAIKAGEVKASEVTKALEITKKKAQGFKLTPAEQELAARIARGARKGQGTGKGVMYAIPAAAAATAALLI
jgi:hypothetical protein